MSFDVRRLKKATIPKWVRWLSVPTLILILAYCACRYRPIPIYQVKLQLVDPRVLANGAKMGLPVSNTLTETVFIPIGTVSNAFVKMDDIRAVRAMLPRVSDYRYHFAKEIYVYSPTNISVIVSKRRGVDLSFNFEKDDDGWHCYGGSLSTREYDPSRFDRVRDWIWGLFRSDSE